MPVYIVVEGISVVVTCYLFIRFVSQHLVTAARKRIARATPPQLPPLPPFSPFSVPLSLSNRSIHSEQLTCLTSSQPPTHQALPPPYTPFSSHVGSPATQSPTLNIRAVASTSTIPGTTNDENGDESSSLLSGVQCSTENDSIYANANPNAIGASLQLIPLSPLSSTSTRSDQSTSAKSSQPLTPQSPPPYTLPYLLTSPAQHPHHVHLPTPPNTAVAPASHTAAITLTLSQPPGPSPILLDIDQGIDIVSNPSVSPFPSPSFSDPFDIIARSPGLQASPSPTTSLESPFIPLSVQPLPISPVSPSVRIGGGQQRREPLGLFGSTASMMTNTIRQSSLLNRQAFPNSTGMFRSLSDDSSNATSSSQASPASLPPRLPPPMVQSSGVLLSFPSEVLNQLPQPHRPTSTGIMTPVLSELEFISEPGSSDLNSNDSDDSSSGSEFSWSSQESRDSWG